MEQKNEHDIIEDIFSEIMNLCKRRKETGAIGWDAKSTRSLNALVELRRIDERIVNKVLEIYEFHRVGERYVKGWLEGFAGSLKGE